MDSTEKLKKRILIIDDQPEIAEVIEELVDLNYEVTIDTALNAVKALKLVEKNIYSVICTDQNMPGIKGTDFLNDLRAQTGPNQEVPVVFITADIKSVTSELNSSLKNVYVLDKVDEIQKVLELLTGFLA